MRAPRITASFTGATFALTILSACGAGGTRDIHGEDTKTFIGHFTAEKKLSNRSAASIDYLGTTGNNTQIVGGAIQQDGIRVAAPENSTITLRNRFSLHAVTASYKYALYNGERFKFTAAPALQVSYADIASTSNELSPQFREFTPAYGFKLGTSLDFTDRTSAVFEYGFYDQGSDNFFHTTGVWLEHELANEFHMQLGYRTLSVGDGNLGNRDRCTVDSLAEECNDSEFEIDATGVHLGIKLNR